MDPRIKALRSTSLVGRHPSCEQISDTQATVAAFPALSRHELGQTVGDYPGWRTGTGTNRIQRFCGCWSSWRIWGCFDFRRRTRRKCAARASQSGIPRARRSGRRSRSHWRRCCGCGGRVRLRECRAGTSGWISGITPGSVTRWDLGCAISSSIGMAASWAACCLRRRRCRRHAGMGGSAGLRMGLEGASGSDYGPQPVCAVSLGPGSEPGLPGAVDGGSATARGLATLPRSSTGAGGGVCRHEPVRRRLLSGRELARSGPNPGQAWIPLRAPPPRTRTLGGRSRLGRFGASRHNGALQTRRWQPAETAHTRNF